MVVRFIAAGYTLEVTSCFININCSPIGKYLPGINAYLGKESACSEPLRELLVIGGALYSDYSLTRTMDYVNNKEGFFRYFSFGSNLNSIRIHLDNPSAVKIGVGKLKDYKLFFSTKNKLPGDPLWTGGCANIKEEPGQEVWGVVWKIDLDAMSNLDRQEGIYKPKAVTVEMSDGASLICRTYQMFDYTVCPPTPAYKQVCIEGAKENSLPEEYITRLMEIEDNGDVETVTPTMQRMKEMVQKSDQTN